MLAVAEIVKIGFGAAASTVASAGTDIIIKQAVKQGGKVALTKAQKVAVGAASLALGSVVGKEVYNTTTGRDADEDLKAAGKYLKEKTSKKPVTIPIE